MVNPFCALRRDYKYKPRRHRVKFDLREKAAYIKLARLGQSVNNIAALFKRSRSTIHKVLKQQLENFLDLRKIPRATRETAALQNRFAMQKTAAGWIMFSIGEADKPP